VETDTIIAGRSRKICITLGVFILLTALYSVTGREVRANSQNQMDRQAGSSEQLVIQGRITGMQGTVVTVKVPNGYPAENGGHAQFVTAGPIFRADISHARVLLPDGKQTDKLPLVIGDRVLMVLTGGKSGSAEPSSFSPTYAASIVERVVEDDKVITH
jgi:hypothetical protein